jgi:hypothetical protein
MTIGANFNGELEELNMTIDQVLNKQGRRDQVERIIPPKGGDELKQKINIFEKMKQAAQAKQGIREEAAIPPVTGATTNVASSSPTSVGVTSGNTSGGGTTGSSITQNQSMNPSAAANLYAGSTDAALASQFGTPQAPTTNMPRAARGGIISLVS